MKGTRRRRDSRRKRRTIRRRRPRQPTATQQRGGRANVKELMITKNNIEELKHLDEYTSLAELGCGNLKLSSLPRLPNTLVLLYCPINNLTELPVLPKSLKELNCDNNQLTSLPDLPNTLKEVTCKNNQLTELPVLPESLKELHCDDNQLTSLPDLPNALKELTCKNNQLTELPDLPNSLERLNCSNNPLTMIHELDDVDFESRMFDDDIDKIREWQQNQEKNIKSMFIGKGDNVEEQLNHFDKYTSLTHFECTDLGLSSLSHLRLPDTLEIFACSGNNLTELPVLPESLQRLYCHDNQLTELPYLPSSLVLLQCNNNQLTELPSLPESLKYLICGDNPLHMIQELRDIDFTKILYSEYIAKIREWQQNQEQYVLK